MPAQVVLAAARAVLWRRLRRILIVLVPLVGVGLLAIVLLVALVGGTQNEQPAPSSLACPGAVMESAVSIDGLSPEQAANARTIVAVGRELGVPAYGWVIAVATAMQESSLINTPTGDRDSVGLFQQRAAWGATADRMDPATSARMFYTGGQQGQPGLMQIDGFERMALSAAAQAVQRSAFPNAYAKWEGLAAQVVGDPAVLSADCYVNAAFLRDGSAGSKALAAALAQVGTPYSWGGGTVSGPSLGFGSGAGVVGFDCSSLTQFAWHHAGVELPRVASAQAAALPHLPLDPKTWRAGDLIFLHAPGDPPDFFHHVAMYDGQGGIVHAPRPGLTVEVVHDFLSIDFYRGELAVVGRPGADVGEDIERTGAGG
ncbi:C40 family peptidase [Intrasporangium calvum]|uniref:C40 family peptidase n=1 Tax=Intrasporangium calvum TaxID=53358 RepID=UPI000DF605C9|nr:NlpC/P60 family protein [Intrasporangium calvum]AXG14964.1 NlpC/P60 family protein [Intrasporangium calvum]